MESKAGVPASPVDYEALIAEDRKDHGGDDAGRRAEAARLSDIADNLRTLRERAEEQANPTRSEL